MIEGKDLDREREFLKSQQEQCSEKKPEKLKIVCSCGTEMIVPITEIMWGLQYFCPNSSCKKMGIYKK